MVAAFSVLDHAPINFSVAEAEFAGCDGEAPVRVRTAANIQPSNVFMIDSSGISAAEAGWFF
jgi:hypothetical protein